LSAAPGRGTPAPASRGGLRRAAALVATAAALAVAPSAPAKSPGDAVRRAVAPLGAAVAVQVTDVATRRTVVALRARRVQPLASTTKLLTAAAVLAREPDEAIVTQALVSVPVPGTVLAGDLYLRGAGDPVLGEPQLAEMAAQLSGLTEITGSVVGDESFFDAVRTGPSGDGVFDPELGGPLSALTYDRGAAAPGGPVQADPARAAAARLDDLLEARGVVVRGVPRAGVTPPGATRAALAVSVLNPMLKRMLIVSDDWIAETLTKRIAALTAPPGTTAAGAALVARTAARLGAPVSLVDGSGLDPRDRGTAAGLVRLLVRTRRHPVFRRGLARPGHGTLEGRMGSGPARRRCRGKTGTLPSGGVSNLAGMCRGRNGHRYAFAVLVRGRDTAQARRAQDRVARALAAAR
jgi:serine-type D-Ala-D-Ala carboxypeptidase/endopeptidase (penicillin-binding protein 4)